MTTDWIERREGDEGFVPYEDDGEPCCNAQSPTNSRGQSYFCTLTQGHDGPHAAHGEREGDEVQLVSWENAR